MSPVASTIVPPARIGIVGSGQLGRMLALVAKRMGYRVVIFSPEKDSPAGQVSDVEMIGSYDDTEAARSFVQQVDVVTFEFENIPASLLEVLEHHVPVYPSPSVLYVTQNRLREKTWLREHGFPVVPFQAVSDITELQSAFDYIGISAVLKTAGFGYDGKGQQKVVTLDEAKAAYQTLDHTEAILEQWVSFSQEISVIAARGQNGEFVHYGVTENVHQHHILDMSIAPGRVEPEIKEQAIALAESILNTLDVVGVMGIEFFLTSEGALLVNELAPRPHNSGHWTIDAAKTSQFEQQLRAICGLPLGSTRCHSAAVMVNLLGDLWQEGAPDWKSLCAVSNVKLHLYGKHQPKPGRKMGHLTVVAPTVEEAISTAVQARSMLSPVSSRL